MGGTAGICFRSLKIMTSDIIAIIPARGGAKGIPRKNLVDFCGKPLVAWTIQQARAAGAIAEVYVTSDCQEILKISEDYGALPILRPGELATDEATSESALLHALDVISERTGRDPEFLVFLQATSPLRAPGDIDGAVGTLRRDQGDSLFSGSLLDDFCAWKKEAGEFEGLTFDPRNRGRRQDREPLYLENGSIYVLRPEILRREGNRLGGKICFYDMEPWKSHEIDTPDDAEIASGYFKRHLLPDAQQHARSRLSVKNLDLVVYDFDGVMTDNRVFVMEDGREAVRANRADGLGVDMLRAAGLRQFMISTETNEVVAARARKLGLEMVHGCADKATALSDYCRDHRIELTRVVYVGNDTNDLEAMSLAGLRVAPADAHPAIIATADLITRARGGEGVIRELADHILG